ncbi:MAG: hypothetical protein RLY31_721 [Bacteroidota bacterium]
MYRYALLSSLLLLAACSPRAADTVMETTAAPDTVREPPAQQPCKTFDTAANPDLALEEFVLYRDFLKAGDWEQAFPKWQYVLENAPAADGRRSTVFTDGIRFYEHFMSTDSTDRDAYIDKVFALYDKMAECYPEGGLVAGLKAFDGFFKYGDRISKEEQYALFEQSVAQDGGKPRYFILNPFTALLVERTLEGMVPLPEARRYDGIIRSAIAEGLATCKGTECDNWAVIQAYAPSRLEALESVEDFYDCDYYLEKYYPLFESQPGACEVILNVYSRLRWGKCPVEDPRLVAMNEAYQQACQTESGPSCNDLIREGRYRDAVACLEESLPNVQDDKGKAQYNHTIAQIQFAYLKNFPAARKYAWEAARLRPGWGEPYLLIGTLYASSGPLCGPGRGWDSQVVVWPAIDMWNKAKTVDPGVADQANKLIREYTQYMPSDEDIFLRLKKEGDAFFVPCWIQTSTTIRARP